MDEMIKETIDQDEHIYIKLIEQSLEGVMFHNYNIDIFDLLCLDGFKKLHTYQYKDEGNSLACLKHEYISKFHKLPTLQLKTANLWHETYNDISEERVPEIVRSALTAYYDWESGVLENLLSWRKEAKDKTLFQGKVKDVMCEIERLETIMDILESHNYDYGCICEMSNYLYYQ